MVRWDGIGLLQVAVLRIVNQAELPEELELVEIRALGLAADEACQLEREVVAVRRRGVR
jgi:hypothetical protein